MAVPAGLLQGLAAEGLKVNGKSLNSSSSNNPLSNNGIRRDLMSKIVNQLANNHRQGLNKGADLNHLFSSNGIDIKLYQNEKNTNTHAHAHSNKQNLLLDFLQDLAKNDHILFEPSLPNPLDSFHLEHLTNFKLFYKASYGNIKDKSELLHLIQTEGGLHGIKQNFLFDASPMAKAFLQSLHSEGLIFKIEINSSKIKGEKEKEIIPPDQEKIKLNNNNRNKNNTQNPHEDKENNKEYIYYPRDLNYLIKTDNQIKDIWKSVTLPSDSVGIELELKKAGFMSDSEFANGHKIRARQLTNKHKRKHESEKMMEKKAIEEMKKENRNKISTKTKVTNSHLINKPNYDFLNPKSQLKK